MVPPGTLLVTPTLHNHTIPHILVKEEEYGLQAQQMESN